MIIRFAPVVVAALLPLSSGCDSGLQQRLDTAQADREARAAAALTKVEVDRNANLVTALVEADKPVAPPAAPAEGEPAKEAEAPPAHPLMTWRKAILDRDDVTTLEALADNAVPLEGMTIGARGTPSEAPARAASSFLKDVRDYWSGVSTLSRYMGALDAFDSAPVKTGDAKKDAEQEQLFKARLFQDEAAFDRWFVHAASYLNLASLSDRSMAWNAMHPAYGYAFGISRRLGESVSDYISRLCFVNDTLKPQCKGAPYEFRGAIVDRAFQEYLLKQARDYRASPAGAVFSDVAKRIGDAMDKALEAKITFSEDPVLPSTVAAVDGRSGIRFVFSNTSGITVTTDEDAKLSDKFDGRLPPTFAADVAKIITDLKDKPGNRVDYQRIILEAPGDLAMDKFLPLFRSFPAKIGEASGVKEVFLVGRRRADDSLRLAALKVRIPRADDSPTMSYQLKEDTARTTCQLVGRVGDPPAGKKDQFDLVIAPSGIRATAITEDEAGVRTPGDTVALGTPADLGPLKAWLEANPGRIRAFVTAKTTYNDLMMLLSDLLFRCTDEKLSWDDPAKAEVTRTCGVSEARSTSFVLALCD